MRFRRLLRDTLLLTAASFLMQAVGLGFQVYLTRRIGAAGVGLFLLTMSVNGFAATVAITGVRFAAMRVVSQELSLGRGAGARRAVGIGLLYAACFGSAAALLLGALAPRIGASLIRDVRTVPCLYRLAMSLPFLSMGTVFTGYFTAAEKVWLASLKGLLEQLVRITVSVLLLQTVAAGDVQRASMAVVTGGVAGEAVSFVAAALLFLWESAPLRRRGGVPDDLLRRLVQVGIPLGLAAWARTALNAAKNLLTPRAFARYGMGAEQAMADYGTVQGMVFPVLLFPSALIVSLAELLVPELTRLETLGERQLIARTASRAMEGTLLFAVGVASMLFSCAGPLTAALYGSTEAAFLLRLFSPLILVMYLDSITDAVLKGLGQQVYSMRINACDSLLSTALILLLVPRAGLAGYCAVIWISELFNFTASFLRLRSLTVLRISPVVLGSTLLAGAAEALLARLLLRLMGDSVPALIAASIPALLLYTTLLGLMGLLPRARRKRDYTFFAARGKMQKEGRKPTVLHERTEKPCQTHSILPPEKNWASD